MTLYIDAEWDYLTGEPLVLAVGDRNHITPYIFKNGKYPKEKADIAPQRVYYKSSPVDVLLFHEVFNDKGNEYVNVDFLERLTDNYSGVRLFPRSLSQQYAKLCNTLGTPTDVDPGFYRGESHLYTADEVKTKEGKKRIVDDVKADVIMLRAFAKYRETLWDSHPNRQPEVLKQYSQDTLNYLPQHRIIHMRPAYINALNSKEKLLKLEERLHDLGLTAFSIGTSQHTGYLTMKWDTAKWTDHDVPEVLKMPVLNYTHKGTLKKRAAFHIEDFDPNGTAAMRLREMENLPEKFRLPIYLVGVVRTQRYHSATIRPFIIPHGTSSGRSSHPVDPINSGLLCRSSVIPDYLWTIISADIQSQEPLLAAIMSGDENLWQCLLAGDVYKEFAKLLGYSASYCDRVGQKGTDERDFIKVMFLQYLYGAGAGRLFTEFYMNRAMQDRAMDILRGSFSELESWRGGCIAEAKWNGHVQLPNGYRLYVDGRHNPRQTTNAAIQGRGAVGMQEWLRYLNARLVGGAYVMCELYDGLYVHSPLSCLEQNQKILIESSKVWDGLYPTDKTKWKVVLQKDMSDPSPEKRLHFPNGIYEKEKYLTAMNDFFSIFGDDE
jgi:hypothetical protein